MHVIYISICLDELHNYLYVLMYFANKLSVLHDYTRIASHSSDSSTKASDDAYDPCFCF